MILSGNITILHLFFFLPRLLPSSVSVKRPFPSVLQRGRRQRGSVARPGVGVEHGVAGGDGGALQDPGTPWRAGALRRLREGRATRAACSDMAPVTETREMGDGVGRPNTGRWLKFRGEI